MQRQPLDGPAYVDGPAYNNEKPTGLLTRFVPERIRNTGLYRWFLRLTRLLQFISSVVSLGIFSQRFYKVYRLVNSIKTRRGVNGSYGAVEGILAAAVLYTLITTLFSCIKKNSSPGTARWLRWLWVLLDLAFVGAFIAVSVLTRPNGGMAGPRHCYSIDRLTDGSSNATGETASNDDSCNLPWGTFILAIVSTVLHAITAAFHEVRDRHRRHKRALEEEKAISQGYGGRSMGAAGPTVANNRY
ncbi:uncharacterized protein CTRU02_206357 [Colletotrichum truncatum]|uniref:Uncharacterized protein n=1 Tax=Colletotrichum truncatum TaxID=5467 RepID=A0ACC3Z6Q4_COLTU|nr:uncharacterized protein CTRU02_09805 [Colletotrichum truncatum]KAF6787992.1 hypothetical protein CTRU02_09805 [Colletotrichum truncatum]